MSVRLDEINIEDSGPISGLQLELGPFNLIYGRNERGKTFLVEFLIRSLFKNHAGWSLRSVNSRGKVAVSGVANRPLIMTPSSGRKLEDYLTESEEGLPAQISRLLVVKGAELNFDDHSRDGIDRNILKNLLSGQSLLDVIQRKISVTVRDSKIEGGQISGPKRGEIKSRNNLHKTLQALDQLFEAIESTYSNSERSALEKEIGELQEKIDEQKLAKRHQAFLINEEIDDIQSRLDLLPEDDLQKLDDDFKAFKNTQQNVNRHEKKLAQLRQDSEHYEWLEQAIPLYEQRGGQKKNKIRSRYPVIILVMLVLALLFSLIAIPIAAIAAILGVAIVGWLQWRESQAALDQAIDADEVERLEIEFETRFGRPLSGLPLMLEEKKGMEEAYFTVKTQGQTLRREEDELANLHDQVAGDLETLTGQRYDAEAWEAAIRELSSNQKRLNRELGDKKLERVELAVEPAAYRAEPAAVLFDPVQLAALQDEQAQIQETLNEKTRALSLLQQRICDQTGDDISTGLETLIGNLQSKREQVVADYCQVTTKVVAGVLVNQALNTIRTQEDKKIRDKLSSPQVRTPIEQITGRYTGVRYRNGKLLVDDPFGHFPISDLSSGAREQVLLGLRLGFAAQIFGRDRLFLILDDAFQHADWERRERLLDQMVDLAHHGWQIIYLTMDDHIKELFDTAGKRDFGQQYRSFDLNETAVLPA